MTLPVVISSSLFVALGIACRDDIRIRLPDTPVTFDREATEDFKRIE